MLSTIPTLNVETTIRVNTTWFPTFISLVVLNSFHPFAMLILGDPIFLFLVTHIFICLIFLCLPHIIILCQSCHRVSFEIYGSNRPTKNQKWFKVDQCGICKLILEWEYQHFVHCTNLLSCKMIKNKAEAPQNFWKTQMRIQKWKQWKKKELGYVL